MSNSFPRLCNPILAMLGVFATAFLTSCEPNDSGGTVNGETEQNGLPSVSFQVKHFNYPEANQNAKVIDDIPDPITIKLNGIPGRFGGTPTPDHLFDTTLIGGASFSIPWARLLQAPGTQPLSFRDWLAMTR
ncbi:MAG: hypothetical protein ABI036_07620 [Fibrobacteria bacterium]